MTAPTINISETIGLTNVSTAESTTNFDGFRHSGGGSPNEQNESDIFVQGTQAVSIKVSGSTRDEGVWYTNVGSVDLTGDANKHVFLWAAMTTMSQMDTRENGGLYVIVASSTSNWNKYYVGGSDVSDGAFKRYVVDITKPPSETAATAATLTAVTHIGIGCKSASVSSKVENLILDRIDYGTGLQIEDGDSTDPCTWQELFDDDDLDANKYGIIEERSGVFYLKGGLQIGDGSGTKTSLWDDTSGAVVEFDNPLYHNGTAVVSSIDSDVLYKIVCEGNTTGTTDIKFGTVIGTGDDRLGLKGGVIQSDGPKWTFDAETDVSHLTSVEVSGVSWKGSGILRFDVTSKTTILGSTFTECGEIQINLANWLNNTIISPVPDLGLELGPFNNAQSTSCIFGDDTGPAERCWQVDISAVPDLYVEMTDEFNNATAADVVFFPATEATSDFFAIGSKSKFSKVSINVSTARSGGSVSWSYWNGSFFDALSRHALVDGTNGLSTTGTNTVSFDLTTLIPDWETVSLNGESPLYYIAVIVETVMTTNPIGTSGEVQDINEHMISVPTAGGTIPLPDFEFFGSGAKKFDVASRDSASLVDSYNDEIQLGKFIDIGDGTDDGAAQSFTGLSGEMVRARVALSKVGSPTGNLVLNLYAHSGTFGTSSIPTGAVLAVSEVLDVSTLTTAETYVDFEFRINRFTLVSATKYVLAVEYTGGDVSNFVQVSVDDSFPSHAGNKSVLSSSTWTADSAVDLGFWVWVGGVVTIQATGTSDPVESEDLGPDPGITFIENLRPVEVTGVTEGTRVSVHRTSDNLEILNELAFDDDGAGAFKASTLFDYTGDTDVRVAARCAGKPAHAQALLDFDITLLFETDEANDAATNMTLTSATPLVGDKYHLGQAEQFAQIALEIGTVGSGITLLWEYWDGDSWESLGATDSTSGYSQDGIVSWTIPGDWAKRTLPGSFSFYFVRARITAVASPTVAVGSKVTLDVTRFLPFRQDNTIISSGLSVKATWIQDPVGRFPSSL